MYKNEVYNDLINNHIVFKYPSIANGALVRLVIYNEKEGYFPFIFQMMSSTDKVTLNYKSLLPHFQYKYRYQYLSNKKWHNLTEYKYIRVEFKNESGVGYLLFLNPDSNYLVVGFAGNGKRPAYHYVGTISEIDTNKLFILDDFSSETSNNSAFYVGTKGNKNVMKNVYELIESIRISNDVNKKNVICIGSSKGGFASLLYALNFNYGGCIIGSPTIYLGNRLLKESNMFKYAKAIAGDTNEKAMRWLNNLVSEEITDETSCDIKILIGGGETRYKKHVLPFQESVKNFPHVKLKLEVLDFSQHKELIKYYPNYLVENLRNIINE